MGLNGPFQDTGAGTGTLNKFNVTETPAQFSLGEALTGHFILSFIFIIRNPGADGTKIVIKDQEGNNIIPGNNYVRATLQRTQEVAINIEVAQWLTDHSIAGDKLILTGHIEGVSGSNTVEGIALKQLIYLENL
jgi:hypothetical protein